MSPQGDLIASSGAIRITSAVYTNRAGGPPFGAYCFDLEFAPIGMVGSTQPAGTDAGSLAWSVMTVGSAMGTVITYDGRVADNLPVGCPDGFKDAAIVVRSGGDRLGMPLGGSVFVLFV